MCASLVTVALAVLTGPVPSSGHNLVQNGSFEDTAVLCAWNCTNPEVGLYLPHVTGFGAAEELELVHNNCAWGIAAAEGRYKIGLHCQPTSFMDVDAVALELATPVRADSCLSLSLQVAGRDLAPLAPLGAVEIGLSDSPFAFGTLVATAPATSAEIWDLYTFEITAPHAATHLTVRHSVIQGSYTLVDDIVLLPIPCTTVGAAP